MTISRDDFYKHFGPRLLETIVRYFVDEINTLRTERNRLGAGIVRLVVPQFNVLRAEHGMTQVTEEQALAALENDIGRLELIDKAAMLDNLKTIWDSLPLYDWTDE